MESQERPSDGPVVSISLRKLHVSGPTPVSHARTGIPTMFNYCECLPLLALWCNFLDQRLIRYARLEATASLLLVCLGQPSFGGKVLMPSSLQPHTAHEREEKSSSHGETTVFLE